MAAWKETEVAELNPEGWHFVHTRSGVDHTALTWTAS
jgi:hypothetical protein